MSWSTQGVDFQRVGVAVWGGGEFGFEFFEEGYELLAGNHVCGDTGADVLKSGSAELDLADDARLRNVRDMLERAVRFEVFAVSCSCGEVG